MVIKCVEIKSFRIISIQDTGEHFEPNNIADSMKIAKPPLDLRRTDFVLVPDRDWFK